MKAKNNGIEKILRSPKTIFSIKDIVLLWDSSDSGLLKRRLNHYVKTGKLYQVRRGIYAKDKDYDRLELATKIYTPAYVSFETVLQKQGVVFQHYKTIFVACYLSREITVNGHAYSFKKLKDGILANPKGLVKRGSAMEASKERAFMDAVYLYKNYHFDNLRGIDWKKCFDLLPVYASKAMEKKLNSYYRDAHRP